MRGSRRRRAHVDITSLVAGSVTETAGGPQDVHTVQVGPDVIEVVRRADALFLPEPGLQVLEERLVPVEAIVYPRHLALRQEDRSITKRVHVGDAPWVRDDVCILANTYSRNFYHMHEELLRVVALERLGFDGTYVIPDGPPHCRELVLALGVPEHRLATTSAPTWYASAWYVRAPGLVGIHEAPGLLAALRERLSGARDVHFTRGARLWLSRGPQALRPGRIVNDEEVGALVDRYELAVVDFGALPLSKQIAAALDATLMAGPHGAAFVHCLLMPPRSRVIELFSPHYVNNTTIGICRALEHDYRQLVPPHSQNFPYRYGEDLFVDCVHLDMALRG